MTAPTLPPQQHEHAATPFTLTLDSSQIATFLECPERWRKMYWQHLQPRGFSAKPLDKGSVMHLLLEWYYTHRFHHPAKSFMEAQRHAIAQLDNYPDFDARFPSLVEEDIQFLKQRFVQYTVCYGAEDFMPISRGGKPAVEIGFTVPLVSNENFLFNVEGKIDFLAELSGQRFFVDHKTQSRRKDLYGKRVQFRTYAWASGLNLGMVNYIGLQKELKEGHLRRTLVGFKKQLLEDWGKELVQIFYRAAHMLLNDEERRNWAACEGKYGECFYTELCEEKYDKELVQIIESAKFEKRPEWRPWAESEGAE